MRPFVLLFLLTPFSFAFSLDTDLQSGWNKLIHEKIYNCGYCHGFSNPGCNGFFCKLNLNSNASEFNKTLLNRISPVTIIKTGVTSVSMNDYHTCAIINETLKCWGQNYSGNLGDGTYTDSLKPITILDSKVTLVTTAINRTCAIVKGAVQCWGDNSRAQLGDGTLTIRTKPITVIPSGATDISGDHYNTCAVVEGSLKCWGDNLFKNGSMNKKDKILKPTTVISSGVKKVFVKDGKACVITTKNALNCWGDTFNELFIGATEKSHNDTPTMIMDSDVSDISFERGKTCAVIKGSLQCWGGVVFKGKEDITPPKTIVSSGVTAISVNTFHSCAIITGSLKCWGENFFGELGDGTKQKRTEPKTIISSGVTAVSTGKTHTCAIVNGALKCWGTNFSGEIGIPAE